MTLHLILHILVHAQHAHPTAGLHGWLHHLHWLIHHGDARHALLEARQVLWAVRHGFWEG